MAHPPGGLQFNNDKTTETHDLNWMQQNHSMVRFVVTNPIRTNLSNRKQFL